LTSKPPSPQHQRILPPLKSREYGPPVSLPGEGTLSCPFFIEFFGKKAKTLPGGRKKSVRCPSHSVRRPFFPCSTPSQNESTPQGCDAFCQPSPTHQPRIPSSRLEPKSVQFLFLTACGQVSHPSTLIQNPRPIDRGHVIQVPFLDRLSFPAETCHSCKASPILSFLVQSQCSSLFDSVVAVLQGDQIARVLFLFDFDPIDFRRLG